MESCLSRSVILYPSTLQNQKNVTLQNSQRFKRITRGYGFILGYRSSPVKEGK